MLVVLGIILGTVFLIAAGIYATQPASALPGFLPGHENGVTVHHYKHAIGALFLALGAFAFSWFGSEKKSTK